MTRIFSLALALGVLAAPAACGGSDSTTPVTATTPALLPTDSFSGTVQPGVNNIDSHTFTVSQLGTISVTLLTAGPPATIQMGLGIGTPGANNSCSLISTGSTIASAGTTAQISLTNVPAGTYCVGVVDIGNASSPISYTLTVSHT